MREYIKVLNILNLLRYAVMNTKKDYQIKYQQKEIIEDKINRKCQMKG